MFFNVALYLSLAVCLAGLAWRCAAWFRIKIGDSAQQYQAGQRAHTALRGLAATLCSPRLFRVLWIFLVDGLLQRRVWRNSRLAWTAHMLIYSGFTALVLMHAMQGVVSERLFDGYYATVNPYLMLRNLFGVMVLAGVGIAIWRRSRIPGLRRATSRVDKYAIILVALIIVSGFVLEGLKIVSHVRYQEMVEEFAGIGDPADNRALAAYWARNYSVAFPADHPLGGPEDLERGGQLHQEYCMECHARPQWAFASFGLAQAVKPVAVALNEAGLAVGLYYLHFLACFVGLALLPWTKFFHLFTSPLLMMINAGRRIDGIDPANLATIRALELEACTHCAACSVHCSVAIAFNQVKNQHVLPSERIADLASLVAGREMSPRQMLAIRQGTDICTMCGRCTQLCPVGVNLQDLWTALKQDLARQGYDDTFSMVRHKAGKAAEESRSKPLLRVLPGGAERDLPLSERAASFHGCFKCMTCTTVCPVIKEAGEDRAGTVGLAPHQIMHALGMGLKDEVLGAGMAFHCLSCYRCQEACPQGVRVTDIMFELTNLAARDGLLKGA